MLATLTLSVIQLELSATLNLANNEGARRVIEVGREIDRLLPAEDIAVAGTYEIALGMPLRLNFGGYCSFTREDSKYWPLAAPQAIVYTPGWDRGCHLLADWLVEYDFRPARCFAMPHLGDGVTILYLLPELMQQERDTPLRAGRTWPGRTARPESRETARWIDKKRTGAWPVRFGIQDSNL